MEEEVALIPAGTTEHPLEVRQCTGFCGRCRGDLALRRSYSKTA